MKITMSQGDWQRLADRLMKSERELKAKLAEAEADLAVTNVALRRTREFLVKVGRELEALRAVEKAVREDQQATGEIEWCRLNDAGETTCAPTKQWRRWMLGAHTRVELALAAVDALRKDSDARP